VSPEDLNFRSYNDELDAAAIDQTSNAHSNADRPRLYRSRRRAADHSEDI